MTKTLTEVILEKVDGRKDLKTSVAAAVNEALGGHIKKGMSVAVINDPAYPFEGAKGKVKAVNNGFAEVEFESGARANLVASLLIPV
jgi:hypothetical protein